MLHQCKLIQKKKQEIFRKHTLAMLMNTGTGDVGESIRVANAITDNEDEDEEDGDNIDYMSAAEETECMDTRHTEDASRGSFGCEIQPRESCGNVVHQRSWRRSRLGSNSVMMSDHENVNKCANSEDGGLSQVTAGENERRAAREAAPIAVDLVRLSRKTTVSQAMRTHKTFGTADAGLGSFQTAQTHRVGSERV